MIQTMKRHSRSSTERTKGSMETQLINRLSGQGTVVVMCPSFKESREHFIALRKVFPQANLRAASWTRPESFEWMSDVLFLYEVDPQEVLELMQAAPGCLMVKTDLNSLSARRS